MDTTIVVPAYKEAGNLKPLVERVFQSVKDKKTTEIIIVDDNSQDGSFEIIEQLKKKYNVRIIVRTKERGLSSAVMRGFEEARGDLLLCMDADLQHPPEKVPELIEQLRETEFVIGTRYLGQNTVDKDWPLYRRVISNGARLMAYPLTPLSDPMTGFFGIQKHVLKRGKNVSPIGFKICMELFVKCNVKKHAEVPIFFGVRTVGESKLSSKVIINYLHHLMELYWYKYPLLIVLVLLVGILTLFFSLQLLLQ
ncbi:dolichol phosphate beta-d-mannosyltransferase-like protein [Gorgonomyces haynaldii]|nr:dolichol phosphate beta-d-mannosyltransferase-like protein [Gorgonomyces haynaldii]